ncbi:hypothetical protein F443_04370 [Phytophthora nicotianae P1569]|uniref:Uncharacterized protein n=1 Tax=Phytophthora nicotianae P1569 TaxID=1317065 RepID=V9FM19_PHYNI|nr:hypothetical protein F443_04370 [Phytophthora nicotianae P1569]
MTRTPFSSLALPPDLKMATVMVPLNSIATRVTRYRNFWTKMVYPKED